ncbi:MAG: NAD(P)-dependent oxidoreductase [Bacteroidota bacterium]
MRLHIAETEDFSKDVLDRMNDVFELSTGPVKNLRLLLEEVDVFWFRLGYKIDSSVIGDNTRCKVLATPVTGIDHINEDLCAKNGIKIICLRGETEFLKEVRATAEHCVLLTLMLMRKAEKAVRETKTGRWERDLYRGNEVYKKRIGILGMGRLGTIVASYFRAMGCEICYFDTKKVDVDSTYTVCKSAEEVVTKSDIISIHIPYNKTNHHIYGKGFFEAFDNTKWLINTARGAIIDETYLLKVLQENTIKGAALDVLEGEPEVSQNPLLEYSRKHDNLIITPHIGGNTYESFEKTEHFIADRILEAVGIKKEKI